MPCHALPAGGGASSTLRHQGPLTFTQPGTCHADPKKGRVSFTDAQVCYAYSCKQAPNDGRTTVSHIQGFDNMDEMYAAMAAAEDAANLHLTPGQIRLRDDTDHVRYFVKVVAEWGLVIYGRVPPIAETQASADFDVADNRERGYLTGTAFSNAVSERGEHGDTHVSEVVPITPTEFVMAERLGWPDFDALVATPEGQILGRRLAACEEAALR